MYNISIEQTQLMEFQMPSTSSPSSTTTPGKPETSATEVGARKAAHKAKMAMKKSRVAEAGFTPMDDKRFRGVRLQFAIQGRPVLPNIGSRYRASGQANLGRKHPDYGKTVAEHLRRKAARS